MKQFYKNIYYHEHFHKGENIIFLEDRDKTLLHVPGNGCVEIIVHVTETQKELSFFAGDAVYSGILIVGLVALEIVLLQLYIHQALCQRYFLPWTKLAKNKTC